ncbi:MULTISPECIES: hypothetical protein [Paraburkholderia]|uniref:hypothetical protein n=1 Tax=Paraburkholderia TaxID=1822464 RepID=UPI00039B393C|nr:MULTISPECIES: hypothetical protein [Paraburkholderia]MDH6146373.1 hypothetical protein [Paraburkholderia sp. WSM4179]
MDVAAAVLAVMQSRTPREAEVRRAGDEWFLRRIHPFLSQTGATGVAVKVTDISKLKRAKQRCAKAPCTHLMMRLADALRGRSG